MERKLIGRYIVADPKICHGKPTFRGTRILVADVLAMVASGRDWYSITEAWDGKVPREAIAEAVGLAHQAFFEHLEEFVIERIPV
jgi:uncharacterized protein (DUF433 family)